MLHRRRSNLILTMLVSGCFGCKLLITIPTFFLCQPNRRFRHRIRGAASYPGHRNRRLLSCIFDEEPREPHENIHHGFFTPWSARWLERQLPGLWSFRQEALDQPFG